MNNFQIHNLLRLPIVRITKLVCFILTITILEVIASTDSPAAESQMRPVNVDDDVSSLEAHTKQGIAIAGTVTDETGETMPGVNILVKGSLTGTITDIDGKYTITVPDANATLVFSFIGYAPQEVIVGEQRTINIALKEAARQLDEVVVVGYATVKKANLTGAVDQLKGDILENRAVTSAAQALQGTVANLNISSGTGGAPGATQAINIRGYTGFGKTGGPLIVTDGVQGGSLQDINPDDIESISILKDAASSAIYGSSAPYGVIIITTKKGRPDAAPKITYSNNFGFAQPINLPKMVNSLYFAELFNEASVNAGRSAIYSDATIQRIKGYQAGTFKDETIANPNPGTDSWYSWGSGNANNDWFDIYYKNISFAQQHNVGVSGGAKNSNYYVGLGYNQKNGMYNYGDDTFKRFNIRTNLTSNLTDWLTFNVRGAYSRELTNTPNTYASRTGGNYMHQIARKWPTVPLRNPDGHYSETSDVMLHEEGGRNKTEKDKASITGEFVVKPLPGWDMTFNYTFDGVFTDYQSHLATIYQTLPSGNPAAISGTTPNGFARSDTKDEHQIINAFTSYEHTWGDHYFKALAGYTQELFNYQYFIASNNYLYANDIPSLALTYGTSSSNSDAVRQLAVRGGFGRINYGYKEKYLLEFNARYDGTSRFLNDVRFRFYPGVSAAWVASKEGFWEPLDDVVDVFKLRASYGSLGDQSFLDEDAPNWYPFYPFLGTARPTSTNWIFNGGRQGFVTFPPIINDDLTWITTTTLDFGFDLEMLKNRLVVVFDWYIRKSNDFVGPSEALPAVLGAIAPNANNASMETRGIDLTITWRDQIGDLGYSVRAVLSDYQGKVTKFPNPTGALSTWRAGQKMGEIWGYETYGLFQSDKEVTQAPSQAKINANPWTPGDVRYVDRNGNNEIDYGTNTESDSGDRYIIGNNTPRFAYGLTLDANYKGFDFSIFFQGVAKRNVWLGSNSNYFWGIDGRGDEWQSSLFTVHQDRWTTTDPGGYFPKYYMNNQMGKNTQEQTRYLQSGAYMRIKNLQIGYTLPKVLVEKIKFDKVRVFISVENLATATKLISVMDPEFSLSDGKLYPLQRTWSGGINITF